MTTALIYDCPDTGLPAIDAGGQKRLLAKLAPDGRMAARPHFADAFPVIPRNKWQEMNRRVLFPYSLDQGSHGSCTDHAGCYVHRKTRVLMGMADVELSATFGYAQVNGGRDQGAQVHDILVEMQQTGRCLMSECPESVIYKKQIPASAYVTAKRFTVSDAWILTNFDEIASAILYGFIPALAIQVGNNFNSFDSDGAVGFSKGQGNHAVHVDGLKLASDGKTWMLDMMNSWSTTWGDQGRGYLKQEHVDSVQQDSYAVRVANDDPQDGNKPPAA